MYYWTTNSTVTYPYNTAWTTSTTIDCSGYTSYTYKERDIEYIKHWIESLKKQEITEQDILDIIEGDE